MNRMNNRFLVIAFLAVVVLFLYFGNGAMMDGGMNGRMSENGWMGSNSWRWFPTIVTFVFIVLIGWQLFRKKI